MKSFKSLLLVAALVASSVLSASTVKEKANSESTIHLEIGKLLKNPDFDVNHEIKADVTLTLNKNNELVVLSVDSEDQTIDGFIKGRLNYHELPAALQTAERTFVVPVRVTPEE